MAKTKVVVDPITRIEGHLRIEVNLDDKNVIRNAVSTGTMWRGLEVILKGRDPRDAWAFTERICGVCSAAHALGYCEALEQIAGVAVPPRARLIRGIALELERLYNHVGDIGNICAGASFHWGAATGMRRAVDEPGDGGAQPRDAGHGAGVDRRHPVLLVREGGADGVRIGQQHGHVAILRPRSFGAGRTVALARWRREPIASSWKIGGAGTSPIFHLDAH